MSPVSAAVVSIRRLLVKRPWIYWLFVALAALGAAASMLERADRVDATRAAWGRSRDVWVAVVDHPPGHPLEVERREVPDALVSGDVFDGDDHGDGEDHGDDGHGDDGHGDDGHGDDGHGDVAGLVARQYIGRGEIVHRSDVVAPSGPQAMTPVGWLVVPVVESPPSGALVGDRARIVSDGISISDDALVVGHHDDVTLLAVPAEAAVLVPSSSNAGRVTLLLVP